MFSVIYLLPFILPNIVYVTATSCEPFHSTFPPSSISDYNSHSYSPFVAISPPGSYKTGDQGLELFLDKPKGVIRTKDGVNDKLADGATVNSTFTIMLIFLPFISAVTNLTNGGAVYRYGKVVFEVKAPVVPGVVTAVILIGKFPFFHVQNIFVIYLQRTDVTKSTLNSSVVIPPTGRLTFLLRPNEILRQCMVSSTPSKTSQEAEAERRALRRCINMGSNGMIRG